MVKIRNPSVSGDGTYDCEVQMEKSSPWVPFTANANDPSPLGRHIHAEIVAGRAGKIAPQPAVKA